MDGEPDETEMVAVVAERLGVEPGRVTEALDATYGSYRAVAAKRGLDARWPYVPLLERTDDPTGTTTTRQVLDLAFATRDEAIGAASAHLQRMRRATLERFGQRRFRAERSRCGLPRELVS